MAQVQGTIVVSVSLYLLPFMSLVRGSLGFVSKRYRRYRHQSQVFPWDRTISASSYSLLKQKKADLCHENENQNCKRSSPVDTSTNPWSNPDLPKRLSQRKSSNKARFRQHVNPLASQFQQPTILTDDWPLDTYTSSDRFLHLDIGCGKGGFLLDLIEARYGNSDYSNYNYLGLEIRPAVAICAKNRIANFPNTKGILDIIGCNVNVDLDRILSRYSSAPSVQCVSIQFPDPHFKKSHAKRRVVTPALVDTIAQFLCLGTGKVVLQSDVQSVLDDMRKQFRKRSEYFQDTVESIEEYYPDNPFGVSTEREGSVLNRNLPVYRAVLERTSFPHEPMDLSTLPGKNENEALERQQA